MRHNQIGAPARDAGGDATSPQGACSQAATGAANSPALSDGGAGAFWTAEEEALLGPYVAGRLPTNVAISLAVRMDRSVEAVARHVKIMRRRARDNAPKPVPPKRGPLTTEEVQQAYALFARGASRSAVGRALSRSEATIRSLRDRWDNNEDATVLDPVIIRRLCLCCRVEFEQNRAAGNYFLCEAHRGGLGDGWMAENSVAGRVRAVR